MHHLIKIVKCAARFLKRNRALLMSSAEVGGVVGTFALTIRANGKANERRHEAQALKGEELTPWEVFVAEFPAYALPGLICLLTSGTVIVNTYLDVSEKKKLTACAIGATKLLCDYKNHLTKEENEALLKKIAEDHADDIPPKPEDRENKLRLFYDEWSARWFWDTGENVLWAESQVNRELAIEGIAHENTFYKALENPDLPPLKTGDDLGWSLWMGPEVYGYSYVDFWHCEGIRDDGTEFTAISMPFPPTADYLDDPC